MTKHMMQFNILPRNGWRKSGVVLLLLVVFQAEWCGKKSYLIANLSSALDNHKNISLKDHGTTLLHDAVRSDARKNVELVCKRIEKDIEEGTVSQYEDGFPNSVDKTDLTALGLAIERGNLEIVRYLTSKKFSGTSVRIDVNKVGLKQLTSFLLALQKKKREIATCLLSREGIDITSTDPETGETPLHVALRQEYGIYQEHLKDLVWKLVEKLVSTGTKTEKIEALSKPDKQKATPLDVAALYNNRDGFKVVFEKIQELQPDAIKKHLFKEDSKAPSIFALAYSRPPYSWGAFFTSLLKCILPEGIKEIDDNLNMFEYVLNTVKDYLDKESWDKILLEMNKLELAKKLNPEYAGKLNDIVKKIHTPPVADDVKPASKEPVENLITFD